MSKPMHSEAHHNGTEKLPSGHTFYDTDENLIIHYLRNKVMCCPLPANLILEVEVCKSDPWDLPGDHPDQQVKYFFSRNEGKNATGNGTKRATRSGYWKATGVDKLIVASEGNRVLGLRKTLVFYQGTFGHGAKTDWIMHELCLADDSTNRANKRFKLSESSDDAKAPLEEWVLCKIFLKKRKKERKKRKNEDKPRPMFLFDLNLSPASSDSSDSSEVPLDISSTHELKDDDDAEVSTLTISSKP